MPHLRVGGAAEEAGLFRNPPPSQVRVGIGAQVCAAVGFAFERMAVAPLADVVVVALPAVGLTDPFILDFPAALGAKLVMAFGFAWGAESDRIPMMLQVMLLPPLSHVRIVTGCAVFLFLTLRAHLPTAPGTPGVAHALSPISEPVGYAVFPKRHLCPVKLSPFNKGSIIRLTHSTSRFHSCRNCIDFCVVLVYFRRRGFARFLSCSGAAVRRSA